MSSQTFDTYGRTRRRSGGARGWRILSVLAALIVATPVLVVLAGVTADSGGVWRHLAETVLADYVVNTLVLMAGVAVLVLTIGVGAAWLVTMHRFPGSRILEWALLLPLAVPAYVMAYAYTDLLQYAGPVQSTLRAAFGWTSARDYWFPQVRSTPGAIAMLGFVLYPYVYLLARSAFLAQSVCVLEVSRLLGCGPWRSLFGVGLPLARPAIVAGLALAMMETIADYGTVAYFGVPTFTTGIYRTWFGMGAPAAAVQLAAVMLLFVAALVLLERWSRRGIRVHTAGRYQALPVKRLTGWRGWGALALCVLPIAIGFLVPVQRLVGLALTVGDQLWGTRFVGFAVNSFMLAAITAVVGVAIATVLAYAKRLSPSPAVRASVGIAALGYAVPGSVIATGILLPLGTIDNAVDAFARSHLGVSTGLLFTGTIAALVYAYTVRFLAVSYNTIEAALEKISPNMDHAARTLGQTTRGALLRVHAPMMAGGMLTAGLIVFVDVLKELPATMILRPFNFETLAVRAYRLAADERLAEASTAALTIVLVGILPVILLSRAIGRSRPGTPAQRG